MEEAEELGLELQRQAERLANYCLMDDLYMTKFFDGDKKYIQLVLRIILNDPGLEVESVCTQKFVANLSNRSVRLDVVAQSGAGERFNVEVQRSDEGADPRRARFNSSALDMDMLHRSEKFQALPESYVIFITKNDVLNGGRPLYRIDRTILDMEHAPFNDGSHILYVNGEKRDEDTGLGRLMHDFFCSDPDKMYYAELKERAEFFKKKKEGIQKMGGSYEEVLNEGIEQGIEKGEERKLLECLRKMVVNGGMSLKQAMDMLEVPEAERPAYKKELRA